MKDDKPVKHGEVLMILVKRSGKDGKDIAKDLRITPQYLSMLFKKQTITRAKRDAFSKYFGIQADVFETGLGYQIPENLETVNEPEIKALEEELSSIKAENQRLAEELLREREMNDDLRAILKKVAGGGEPGKAP